MKTVRVLFFSGKTVNVDIPENGILFDEIKDYIISEYFSVFGETLQRHRMNLNTCEENEYDYFVFMSPPEKNFTEREDEIIYTFYHEENVMDSIDYIDHNTHNIKSITVIIQPNVYDSKGLNPMSESLLKLFFTKLNECYYSITTFSFFPKRLIDPTLLSCFPNLRKLRLNFIPTVEQLYVFQQLSLESIEFQSYFWISQEWLLSMTDTSIREIVFFLSESEIENIIRDRYIIEREIGKKWVYRIYRHDDFFIRFVRL